MAGKGLAKQRDKPVFFQVQFGKLHYFFPIPGFSYFKERFSVEESWSFLREGACFGYSECKCRCNFKLGRNHRLRQGAVL